MKDLELYRRTYLNKGKYSIIILVTCILGGIIDHLNAQETKSTPESIIADTLRFNMRERAEAHNEVGKSLLLDGAFLKAYNHYVESQKLGYRLKDTFLIASSDGNLGTLYLRWGKPEDALSHFYSSLKLFSALNDSSQLSKLYNNVAFTYQYIKAYDSSQFYFERSMEMKLSLKDTKGYAKTLANQALGYASRNNNNLAMRDILKSIAISDSANLYAVSARSRLILAQIHLQNKDTLKAKETYIRALEITDLDTTRQDPNIRVSCHKTLSRIYELEGNLSQALVHYKQYWSLSDSLNKINNDKVLTLAKVKYETTSKEQKIKLLEAEKKAQNITLKNKSLRLNIALWIVGLSLVSLVLLILIYKQKQKAVKEEINLARVRSSFISTLSHEFRTPLAGIRSSLELIGITLQNENSKGLVQKSIRSVDYLTSVLDKISFINKAKSIKINQETTEINLEVLMDDISNDITKRFNNSQVIHTTITGMKKVNSNELILKQIVYNLVSNSAKYGEGNPIEVSIKTSSNNIVIRVKDSGIGIPKDDLEYITYPFHRGKNVEKREGTGLGLSVVFQSVKELGGKFKIKSTEGEGTTVRITLPVK